MFGEEAGDVAVFEHPGVFRITLIAHHWKSRPQLLPILRTEGRFPDPPPQCPGQWFSWVGHLLFSWRLETRSAPRLRRRARVQVAPSLRHAMQLENRTQVLGTFTGNMTEAAVAFRERRRPRWYPM